MKNKIAKTRTIFPIAFFFALFLLLSIPENSQATEWFENFDDQDFIHSQQHFDYGTNYGNSGQYVSGYPIRSEADRYYRVYSTEATLGTTPFWFGMNSDFGMRYKFDLQIGSQTGTYRHDATFYRFLQAGQIEQNAIMLKYFPAGNTGSGYFYTNTSNGSIGNSVDNFSNPTLRFQIGNNYKYINNTDLNQYREQWVNVEIEMYCSPSNPRLKIWIDGTLDFYREGGDILTACWTDQRFFGNYYPSESGGQAYLSVDNFYKFDTAKNDNSDTVPPVRSNRYPAADLYPGTTQTEMSLTTDKIATCRYATTSGIPYNSMTSTFTETGLMHHSIMITGITSPSNIDYFVKCINQDGYANTSDYTINITVPVITDTYPPELYNGSPSGYLSSGTTSASMSISTNENATCRYATTASMSYVSMTNTFTTTGGISHSTNVSGLANGNAYNYYVRCIDGSSNPNTTDYLISFSVLNDTIPPQRNHTSPSAILTYGTTSTTIVLNTDENATCKFAATSGRNFDTQMTDFTTTGGTTTHSHTISSLVSGSDYDFYVKCEDTLGNTNTDDYIVSFSIESDDIPPVRSTGSPSGTLNAGTTSTLLTLYTDENSTCRYSTVTGIDYASMTNNFTVASGIGHSATVNGLQNGTTYNYYVRCIDSLDNSNSDDYVISFSVANSSSDSGGGSGSDEIDVDIENPTSGEVITDKEYNFKADTNNTDSVKFYYKKSGSDEKIYLGEDDTDDSGLFSLKVNIEDEFDNGDYTLVAKAIDGNDDKSDEKKFSVKLTYNEIQSSSTYTPPSPVEETARADVPATANTTTDSSLTTSTEKLPTLVDSDGDGISDNEELTLGTNPAASDSDSDGVSDETEIINGTDPQKSGLNGSDRVEFEDAKTTGESSKEYQVKNVEMIEKNGNNVLKFSGQSEPNTYVTLYIYSDDPIIVRVKTDRNGNWNYEMDNGLEDGEHEIYVALTDTQGKLKSKSEPVRFVKTAQAVSVIPFGESGPSNQSPVEKMKGNLLYSLIVISAIFIIIAIIVISFVVKKERKGETVQPTVSS